MRRLSVRSAGFIPEGLRKPRWGDPLTGLGTRPLAARAHGARKEVTQRSRIQGHARVRGGSARQSFDVPSSWKCPPPPLST